MRKWPANRSRERPVALGHLESVLGADVVVALGASGAGTEVVRRAVQDGLPTNAVAAFQNDLAQLEVPRPSEYVEAIASRATRARRATLTVEQGERLVRMAGVVARALDVWGDADDASEFLVSPHPSFDGDSPIQRARSELGAKQVDDLLTKLDLGLPV